MKKLLLLLSLILLPSWAVAQESCYVHTDWVAAVEEEFNAIRLVVGLSFDGHLMEIWVSQTDDQWTQIHVDPSGTACMTDHGFDGLHLAPPDADSEPKGDAL